MSRATFYFTAEDGGDPIVFEEESRVKKLLHHVRRIAASSYLRPVEVYLARAAILYVAAKLGIDLAHVTK